MIRQLNAEGNLELVLTPREAASVFPLTQAAAFGRTLGANASHDDMDVLAEIAAGACLFSDEALLAQLLAQHADHAGDDVELLTEMYTDMVEGVRGTIEEMGLA